MVKNIKENKARFDKLMSQLKTLEVPKMAPQNSIGSSVKSLGIIRSGSNGKRVSISKALVVALDLERVAYAIPLTAEGALALSKEKLNPGAIELKLSNDGQKQECCKKICYNAGLVEYLVSTYNLDYSTCVSRTFTEIDIEDANGVPVAFIRLTQPTASAAASAGQEENA